MTNDFKEKLLKYLTGNIEEQMGINEPQFSEVETITNNLNTYVDSNISNDGTWLSEKKEIIQGKDGNSNDLNIYALVSNYTVQGTSYGFIVILDANFNPIQFIDSYSSEVKLGKIVNIKVDNAGSVYLVEYFNSQSKYRLVLLNNIFMKLPTQDSYYCKIRNSYFLPNELQITFDTLEVFKSYTGSNYGFICNTEDKLIVETLKIEVGLANEWTNYTYDYSSFGFVMNYIDGNCYFENDTFDFRAILYQTGNTNIYKFYLDTTIKYSLIDISNYQYSTNTTILSGKILQKELYYFGIMSAEGLPSFTGNQKYSIIKYDNNNLSLINQKSSYTTIGLPISRYRFFQKNGIVFFKLFYQIDNQYNMDFGIIYNDTASYFTLENSGGSSPGFYSLDKAFIVTTTYNLITYYIPYASYEQFYKCQQIFNQFNYNGLEYENTNSLVPKYGNLYDENGNLIFSRNLYNLSINAGTTTSTIEIPNTFLNDTTIAEQNLLSETNMTMNNNTNNITKNIYETLDINFINTINIQNNDEIIDNDISSLFNYFINTTRDYTDYQQNIIRRALINYTDEDNQILNLTNSLFIQNGTEGQYEFVIYVPEGKTVDNIQFTNYNYMTIYNTISNLNLEGGKYYKIIQPMEVV